MRSVGSVALALVALCSPVRAADGVDGCCADVEAAVTALEAAVARKGNSRVSLQIYGQVNRALLVWDDSFDTGADVVDNTTSSTRVGLIGQASLRPGLVVGYRTEFELVMPASSETFNPADVTHAQPLTATALRQAYWYLSDEALGQLSVGRQWPATGTLTLINLGSQMNDAALHYDNAFSIGLSVAGGIFSDLKWGQIAHEVDALRGNYLRYDTPALLGFVLSGSVGEWDSWDIALRYAGEAHGFRLAAGAGYRYSDENRMSEVKGGASLLHAASGLYATVAAALRDDERSSLIGQPPAYFQYLQVGVNLKLLSYGNTTLYGDLGVYRNFNVGELLRVDPHTGELAIWGTLAQTEAARWGYGIEQSFDEAGVLIYAQAHHYRAEVVGFPCDPNPDQFPNKCGGDPSNLVDLPMRPWSGYVVGMRVRF